MSRFRREKSKVLVAGGIVQGEKCAIIEQQDRLTHSYWVTINPKMDYLIRRYVISHEHKPVFQVDISYTEHARDGWVPTGWRSMLFYGAQSNVSEQISVDISQCAINQAIDPKEFEFEFPSGTLVVDHHDDSRFVVTESNSRAMLTPGQSYEDFLRMQRQSGNTFFFVLGGIFIVLGVVVLAKARFFLRFKAK
jgi:hypothetical protein